MICSDTRCVTYFLITSFIAYYCKWKEKKHFGKNLPGHYLREFVSIKRYIAYFRWTFYGHAEPAQAKQLYIVIRHHARQTHRRVCRGQVDIVILVDPACLSVSAWFPLVGLATLTREHRTRSPLLGPASQTKPGPLQQDRPVRQENLFPSSRTGHSDKRRQNLVHSSRTGQSGPFQQDQPVRRDNTEPGPPVGPACGGQVGTKQELLVSLLEQLYLVMVITGKRSDLHMVCYCLVQDLINASFNENKNGYGFYHHADKSRCNTF